MDEPAPVQHSVSWILSWLGGGGLLAFILYCWWRASDDRGRLLWKWIVSGVDLLFVVFFVFPVIGRGDQVAAFIGVPMAAVAGLIMAIVWTPNITEFFGGKFAQLYDGGGIAADPEPLYSIAEARRRQGKFHEAIAEIEKQLAQFPIDLRGWMMIAEIQADNLHDLQAASTTIERLTQQGGHPSKNIAFALTRLADWHLKYGRDPEAARRAFQQIVDRFPDSQEAHLAHQRIAHLTTTEMLMSQDNRAPLVAPHSEERLGLRPDFTGLKAPQAEPNPRAQELIAQLERFPFDNQTREDLAILYAEEFHRVDLATEQFEMLIAQPHAPDYQVARWFNVLADFQARESGDAKLARRTLERLIERFPNTPAAESAQQRLGTVKLHARAKEKSQAVKLGTYEQNLGLKKRDP